MEREQTTIRLPVELKAEIQKQADIRGISFNSLINALIYKGFEAIHQGLM